MYAIYTVEPSFHRFLVKAVYFSIELRIIFSAGSLTQLTDFGSLKLNVKFGKTFNEEILNGDSVVDHYSVFLWPV
jgi:hypothetical protein